jgi:hypothetical protein
MGLWLLALLARDAVVNRRIMIGVLRSSSSSSCCPRVLCVSRSHRRLPGTRAAAAGRRVSRPRNPAARRRRAAPQPYYARGFPVGFKAQAPDSKRELHFLYNHIRIIVSYNEDHHPDPTQRKFEGTRIVGFRVEARARERRAWHAVASLRLRSRRRVIAVAVAVAVTVASSRSRRRTSRPSVSFVSSRGFPSSRVGVLISLSLSSSVSARRRRARRGPWSVGDAWQPFSIRHTYDTTNKFEPLETTLNTCNEMTAAVNDPANYQVCARRRAPQISLSLVLHRASLRRGQAARGGAGHAGRSGDGTAAAV